MREKAYFVTRPRIIEDLYAIHLTESEEPFEIVKEVTLSVTDYTNFVSDMLANRAFLDGFDVEGINPKQCVLVKQRGKNEGAVLVVPTKDGHVSSAAYIA